MINWLRKRRWARVSAIRDDSAVNYATAYICGLCDKDVRITDTVALRDEKRTYLICRGCAPK